MRNLLAFVTTASTLVAICLVCLPALAADNALVVFPENSSTLVVLRDGEPYVEISLAAWGPNWSWMGFRGEVREQDGGTMLANRSQVGGSGADVTTTVRVRPTGPRQLSLDFDVRANEDTALTYIVAEVRAAGRRFDKASVTATSADGSTKRVSLPLEKKGLGKNVQQFTLVDADGDSTRFALSPACDVPTDGAARIVLAERTLKADAPAKLAVTIDFPATVTYFADGSQVPEDPGFDEWYVFQPDGQHDRPSEIGMQDWLETPAGQHGRITRDGDKLIYNDKPIKLWGLNLCYGTCAPDHELAEKRAEFYAKYGINSVRLHKYADGPGWAGIQSEDSFVRLDPEGLERMDYQIAQFKKHGIYVKLSAHFGSQKLGPADKQYVPYLEEFGSFSGKNRITTPHSAVHYSPELQDVQIRQMVGLLKHKNPYTGMTYAEDPAVAFLEIINEQSILFYSSMGPLKASPTLRKYVAARFCDWLRKKYGTHEKLAAAWGGQPAFDSFANEGFPAVGEHLDKNNILPLGNPWYWDPAQLESSQAFRKGRLMDSLVFLYELQNEFFARYVGAMREAGYDGEILSSNWQAGRAMSHFYNLHSDSLVGVVDRHNYFGGGSSSRINNATMLAVPGSGTLSSGMQQVADRPFMLSEWIHVTPTEWGVEGPAIIGAYAMGLQGWDVSYMFQNRDSGTLSERIGGDRWDVTAPQVLGVFPAVARQVLRGDVAESELIAPCYVHVPSLYEGKLGFEDRVAQQYDVKAFESDKVPAAALAVARCVVDFTDSYRDTPAFDTSKYFRDGAYVSSTGQLRWKPGEKKIDGFFTLDTSATKAVVGFAQGEACRLGNVTINPQSRFGAVYVTARQRDRDLETSNQLLVVAVARARNSGMKVFNDDRILESGQPPIVMEPVKARITIEKKGSPTVYLLDHDGRRTDKTIPVADGTFEIDGARDKTCYYLIEYVQ